MFGETRTEVSLVDLEMRANWRGGLDELNKIDAMLKTIPKPTKKIQAIMADIDKRRYWYELNLSL